MKFLQSSTYIPAVVVAISVAQLLWDHRRLGSAKVSKWTDPELFKTAALYALHNFIYTRSTEKEVFMVLLIHFLSNFDNLLVY